MNSIKIISRKDYEKKYKKPNQKEVWNEIAKPWKTYVVNPLQIVKEFLQNKEGKIIDIGCGAGRNMIPDDKKEYYGIDFSELQIKQAKEYCEKNNINAQLYVGDGSNIKMFKNEMFDYGLCIASLHCIETKQKRKKALQELHRVLKENAEALLTVWNAEDKRFKEVKNHGEIYMSWLDNHIPHMRHYYLFKKKELIDLIISCNFKILEFYEPRDKDRFSQKNWIIRIKKRV